MRLAVTYIPYATSLKEKTGDVITIAQFEEGNILTKTCNDAESGDESDNKSIMMSKPYMRITCYPLTQHQGQLPLHLFEGKIFGNFA